MAYKLGKRPPVLDGRTLAFAKYVVQAPGPAPASVNYGNKVTTWPMYGNDQYGDCTCAAAGHMIENWSANAKTQVTPPLASVISFYEHFVGAPPPPDAGCDMLSVLKYWRKSGLDRHEILAFASVSLNNQLEASQAVYLLGSLYVGVALPNFCVRGNMLATPWVVPAGGPTGDAAPNPENGHCIPAVGYDTTNLYVVTWGEVKTMSWGFYFAYADEAFAVLSGDWMEADGLAPPGFDLATLRADLAKL